MEARRRAGRGGRRAKLVAVAGLALFAWTPSAPAAPKEPRFALAGGCYSLAPASGGGPIAEASQLRLQATDLGSYLLFGTANDFVAASGGDVIRDDQPSPAADWAVEDAGSGAFTLSPASAPGSVLATTNSGLALVPRDGAGPDSAFRFVVATGCAVFPEAELNVTGKPSKGRTRYGEVRGLFDGHMHWMTFEYLGGNFHCGRPWHAYGIPAALPDCAEIEGPQGLAAPVQNFLNYGQPVAPHDTTGWPTLAEWRRDNLTYEGTYYRWLERAWAAGLRLIVMPINENRELCQLILSRRNPCTEMSTVLKGIDDIYELQDYVDAQAGGPGRGFFKIVRNPFQARKVMNRGKMAVVLEVEVSELFNCRGSVPSSCSQTIVDQGLEQLHERGVRSSLLLNKFDNPLTGVRFDGGPIGALINAANRDSYGSFWHAVTCEQGAKTDNTIETFEPTSNAFLAGLITALGVPGGILPVYPAAPHCNTRGLTDLGEHTVERMMDMGMIVNPDHMSQKAVDDTLDLAEAEDYSGVISPHGWMDPRNWPRIFQLGGMAFPGAGSAEGFVGAWETYRPQASPHYLGWGYGADLGGLATQGAPAPQGSPNAVTYPFKSLDGRMTIDKQTTGERTFDYSQEGVAHYGLYADWYEELRKTGGKPIVRDMLRGPEAYLQMWERAVGVPASSCLSARSPFGERGLGRLRLGAKSKRLLRGAGQPLKRKRAWSYCVKGEKGAAQAAVLTKQGKVALVASTAPGQDALGVGPGDPAGRLSGKATAIGGGVFAAPLGSRTVAYEVRGGVVRTVGVAARQAARSPEALRTYLRRVPAQAKARPDTVVSGAKSKAAPQDAQPFASQRDGAQFPYFCGIAPKSS